MISPLFAPSAERAGVRRVASLVLLAATGFFGCASPGSTPPPAAQSSDPNDPDPSFTPEQKQALAELALPEEPSVPPDVSNRWADDPDAALLGRTLFFDPSMSGQLLDGDNDGSSHALGNKGDTGKVACAGCHLPQSAFTDSRSVRQQISLAAGWGKRRAPSLLDVGQSKLVMWDGRRDALYNQIFGVIESPVEMNSSRLYAAEQIFVHHRPAYEALFGSMPPLDDTSRFPALSATGTGCRALDATNACTEPMHGVPGDGAEYDGLSPDDQSAVTRVVVNAGKALGAYERLLSCGASRFDRWARGDSSALTRAEQRGAALFVDRAKCAGCHSGPYLSDERFHNVGMKPQLVATSFLTLNDRGAATGLAAAQMDELNVQGRYSDGDDGRLSQTIGPELEGTFRTPRLRCSSERPSFMHTGQLRTLDDVVAFFNRGGDVGGYPGTSEIVALNLNDRERADLAAFLAALDGPGPSDELLGPP